MGVPPAQVGLPAEFCQVLEVPKEVRVERLREPRDLISKFPCYTFLALFSSLIAFFTGALISVSSVQF